MTGVRGLDRILGGGFLPGSTIMLIGAPGTGKTILAQQMAFANSRAGGTSLFFTGYSESNQKLISHNRQFSFFDLDMVGKSVYYDSLLELLTEGPDMAEKAIIQSARRHQASLVLIDGFGSMRRFLGSEQGVAHFIYSLGAQLGLLGASMVVIIEGEPDERSQYPELAVGDILLALRRGLHGVAHRRMLEVLKVRGARSLGGVHGFQIGSDGITVFPRLETVVPDIEPEWREGRAAFGIAELDAALQGGFTSGTCSVVAGGPGTGKTLLALHFISHGAAVGEPALFVSFEESAQQLEAKARAFGLPSTPGAVRMLTLPGAELDADYVVELIDEDIRQRGTRRLVIDSVPILQRALAVEARSADFMIALVAFLRSHEVTSYMSLEIGQIVGQELNLAETPVSVLAENLLLLRHVEFAGQLRRLFSVLKMRFSGHDSSIFEYAIESGTGFRVVGRPPTGEGLLTGIVRSRWVGTGSVGSPNGGTD